MNERRSDSELVAAHLGGDRTALAAIYDRYADRLHDTAAAMLSDRHDAEDLTHDVFVVAARRLDQLRDPERLRPWLFSILRHEVYRRTKRRGRQRPTDWSDTGVGEMTAPIDPDADAARVEQAELAAFVRAAAGGLAERDQLLLELSVRQGLSGADLADAVGVSLQQCHVLVHRMRERVQRSIGALAVARYGRSECPELQQLLRGWDGTFDPPTRKRIAGHVDDCDTCQDTTRRFAVIPLLSAAPVLAAPSSLRDRVLGSTAAASTTSVAPGDAYRFDSGGFPVTPSSTGRTALVVAAVLALLVMVGGGLLALTRADDGGADAAAAATAPPTALAIAPTTDPATTPSPTPTTSVATDPTTPPTSAASTQPDTVPPTDAVEPTAPSTAPPTVPPTPPPTAPPTPPPGALVLSATTIDLGSTATSGSVSLANTGGRSIDWSISGAPAPFIVGTAGGTLAPGATVDVPLGVDRTGRPEADLSVDLAVTSSSGVGSTTLTLLASVEHAPEVTITAAPSLVSCPIGIGQSVQATVADESPIAAVDLSWTGPGDPGSSPMALRSGRWFARVVPAPANGTWVMTVTATDGRGNSASASRPFVVSGC